MSHGCIEELRGKHSLPQPTPTLNGGSAGRRGSARLGALVLLLVLGSAGAAGWFLTRAGLEEGARAPDAVPVAAAMPAAPDAAAEDTDGEPALLQETRLPDAEADELLRPPEEYRGSGRLHLEVVDAKTGEPLPGLRFLVASERPRCHPLVTGITGDRGEADLVELPEDLLLVETERRPPYCASLTAVWLPEGGRADVTLRAGRGGRVTGRVVDDLGNPLADVPITAPVKAGDPFLLDVVSMRGNELEDVARSDAEGRFTVAALISRPRGIWVVDGEVRPERREPFRVLASSDWGAYASATCEVREGETREIADLMLPRPTRLEGWVRDENGVPQANVLVSANPVRMQAVCGVAGDLDPELWIPPGHAGFEFLPQETLTDGAGRFTLETARDWIVLRSENREQTLTSADALKPGETVSEVELVLPSMLSFLLEITNSAATRLDRPDISVRGIQGGLVGWSGEAVRAPGGVYEVRFVRGSEPVEALRVQASGFASTDVTLPPVLRNGETLQITLEECEQFPLPIRLIRSPEESPDPVELLVSACIFSPEDREGLRSGCCGAGDRQIVTVKATGECTLQLARDRPWWVRVLRKDGGGDQARLLDVGPLRPDGTAAELLLPPLNVPKEPPGDEPTSPEDRGNVTLRVVDASTGEPVRARVEFQDAVGKERVFAASRDPSTFPLPPGPWKLLVSDRKYRPSPPVSFELAAQEERSLGTIALEPKPRIRGRILEADGTPASGHVRLGARERATTSGSLDETGAFEVSADPEELGAPWYLRVSRVGKGLEYGDSEWVQVVSCAPWSLGEVPEFHLAPWCLLEVSVTGIDPAVPGVLRVSLQDASGSVAAYDWPRRETVDGTQIHRFRVAPGTYTITGEGSLYTLPETRVEVVPGETTCTIAAQERNF